MTVANTTTSHRDLTEAGNRHGLSRVFGDIAGAFEAAAEVIAEAFDLSAEARARFPLAD
jgi:hypothetical protein